MGPLRGRAALPLLNVIYLVIFFHSINCSTDAPFDRAVSRHCLSHQLDIDWTNGKSFPRGADYLTYEVSILA